jgi:hypothetical protein
MLYYCYVADCYVGTMDFMDNDIIFTWENDSKLSKLALTYKKYLDLSTTDNIMAFIGERVGDPRRPGIAPFFAHIGCSLNSLPIEIFQKGHGVSINDLFWINETKDNSLWEELRKNYNI